jgi:hypothetical protein
MGKVITSLQFVTQSTPSTPPSTHGNIFASASSLYFINSSGQTYDLASSSGSIKISYYTGSSATQTYTYSKLGNLKYLKVICVGAGGGGGSGRADNSVNNVARFGGKGGGGGAIVTAQFKANEIPSNVTITVGATGSGGAAVSAPPAGSTPGTNGGNTSFGSLVVAAGGTSGSGGSSGQSQSQPGGRGGLMVNCTPSSGQYVLPGFNGGGHLTTNSPTAFAAGLGVSSGATYALTRYPVGSSVPVVGFIIAGCGGGGGGGSIGTFPAQQHYAASSGSGVTTNSGQIGATTGAPSQSAFPGENGASNLGTDALLGFIATGNDINFNSPYGLGAGGSGGGSLGGRGGNGGNYGAGGGGGGCSTTTSGAGGSGGAGLCILIEYF